MQQPLESLVGHVLRGRVRSFKESWGFVTSEAFPGDVFVGLKENPHIVGPLQVDDEVEFEVSMVGSKPMAVNVQVVIPALTPVTTNGQATRHVGTIRSFKETWGFITAPDHEGDLFVGLKNNPHLAGQELVGREVEFEIRARQDGKAEAIGVTVLAGTESRPDQKFRAEEMASLVGAWLEGAIIEMLDTYGYIAVEGFSADVIFHMVENPQVKQMQIADAVSFQLSQDHRNGSLRAVSAIPLAVMKHDLETFSESNAVLMGRVKSFRGTWGFLNSVRFDGDLFVGLKENKHLEPAGLVQGEAVEFEVKRETKGDGSVGYQAMRVRRLSAPTRTPERMEPVASSSSTASRGISQWASSVSVDPASLAPAIEALAHSSPDVLQKLADVLVPLANAAKGSGGPRPRPEALTGSRVEGIVTRLQGDAVSDWAVIASDSFEGEVAAHQGSRLLRVGERVSLTLAWGPRGGVVGTNISVLTQPASAGFDRKPQPGERYVGQVRSFRDTWGFITSSSFNGDLFVGMKTNTHLDQPLEQGDKVQFTVATNKKDLEAINVEVLNRPQHSRGVLGDGLATELDARQRSRSPRRSVKRLPADLAGQIVEGWVRNFKGNFGFANSASFDGDVFVGLNNNRQLPRDPVTGDRIRFEVFVGPTGKAEARNVELL